MILLFKRYSPLILLVFSFSCSTQKVTLDPITINANALGANIYRGSYPRTVDILHTKLDLRLNWDSSAIQGKALIDAKPYFYAVNQLVLDAKGFKINAVELARGYDRQPLKYSYDGKKIQIALDKSYTRDQKFSISIDYFAEPAKLKVGEDIASPGDRGFYFINPDGKDKEKPQQFWTQGETESNSTWFPTVEDPQEKMTQEISITLPKKFTTLSNGYLDFSSDNGDGTRTDSWRQDQPHSVYLAMVAGGDFVIVKDKWEDKEVNYYMEPAYAKNAKLIFGKTPEMIDFFSTKLGVEYPWEKYSQIVVRDFHGGAMENTTATTFFEGMNLTEGEYQDENYEDIISHELFHHWFGDLVTAESWANLPLNEAFATYGEYLWNEFKYGRDHADYHLNNDLRTYLSNGKSSEKDVIRFDYAHRDDMFDDVSYQKGGRILHMLRKTVGDEAFFKALNLYLKKHAYKSAEIHDLRLTFEEVTGLDLNWFFNQWFLSSGHPILDIDTRYEAASKTVEVNIKQQLVKTQNAAYRLPIAIDIYSNGTRQRKEVTLAKAEETFSFQVDTEPELVNVDAEKYLLAEKRERKSVAQYVFQYENAPLFMDRLEALQGLQKSVSDKSARETFIRALKDKSWSLRLMAVKFVPQLLPDEQNQVFEQIASMATADPRSYVRAAAISALGTTYKNRSIDPIITKALSDTAPSVMKALEGLR
ncbi:M1 family metallopeptidase [Pedobacter sp. SYSU D00535]|uniref:M1 family metallopeptidase n=1 Tax=Pedobacter sp. SYSU D00535 TaxID=2810308 RepID=UPI001A96FB7F|nr:M1 family metallopeptidase [Pedobacter sp. SYSU D00535]